MNFWKKLQRIVLNVLEVEWRRCKIMRGELSCGAFRRKMSKRETKKNTVNIFNKILEREKEESE